jgi:CHAT domain-containing protein
MAKEGGLGVAAPAELVASALETSERARARVLFDILAEARVEPRGGSDAALAELLRRRQELQHRLDHKAALQARLLAAKAPAVELTSVDVDLSQLAAEYDDVEAQMRARSPRYAGLTRPQPLSAAEIQSQLLDDQTILLEYSLGERRSYLWVVASSKIKWFELPGREVIEEGARRVRNILRDEQKRPGELEQSYRTRLASLEARFREEAGRLSGMLLGPAVAELSRKRLLVVAGGELQQVPFAALPAPEEPAAVGSQTRMAKASALSAGNGAPPLEEEHEIVNLPSASTLAALRAMELKRPRAPKAVAVLADPVFDRNDSRIREALGKQSPQAAPPSAPETLGEVVRSFGTDLPRLMASRREANAIVAAAPAEAATAALDFAANRTTATAADLSQYRIVHFATHAVFNDRQPELSGVVLSLFDETGRPREDGFLRLHDVYNLDLPVEMVVLSACQTGLGKEVRGEGLIGLTRGFMYAGAPRVVASLWKVDDEATAELMKLFYLNMLRDDMRPPEALRQAQMSLRRQRRWGAPYYWAGFVLQGEWR